MSKTPIFFADVFGENNFIIITSVPDLKPHLKLIRFGTVSKVADHLNLPFQICTLSLGTVVLWVGNYKGVR
jgi:hypothetical protein